MKETMRSYFLLFFLTCLGLLFLTGPWWAGRFAAVGSYNLFITGDSIFLLGLAIMGGVLSAFVLPTRIIGFFEWSFVLIRKRFYLYTALFLASVFLVLIYTNRFVLLSFMNSGDEHSCLFLAECIKAGKWWSLPHPLHEFFEVVHVGNKGGKWFSVYPPGWPLFLALGIILNIRDWINPIMAVAATVLFFKVAKKVFDSETAVIGSVLTVSSAFFIFNNAGYYSHTTCLLMIAIFLLSFLKWQENGKMRWCILAAVSLGYGLLTRYLTMAAIAAPFLAFHLFQIFRKKRVWTKSDFVFWAVLCLGIFANSYYNYVITGNFLNAPNHYLHRWERLGFHKNYTIIDALVYVGARFFYLIDWVSPVLVFAYLFLVGRYFIKEKKSLDLKIIYRLGFFLLPAGYLFYYSWGGNQYGPRYYFEGLPFLAFTVAHGIKTYWTREGIRYKKIIVGLFVIGLLGAAHQYAKHSEHFHIVSKERKALYTHAEETTQKPAIVFIRGFLGDRLVMSEEDAVRNRPFFEARVLYAHDLGSRNKELMAHFPDRDFYIGHFDRSSKKPVLEKVIPD